MAGKPPSRGIERFTDLPIALAVRAVGGLVGRLGPRSAYKVARWLGGAWYRAIPSRRWIAHRNLEIAFRGEMAPGERERIALTSFSHAMATAMDVFLRERAINAESWPRFISLDEGAEEALARPHPRGFVALSAHLGDWEMTQYLSAVRGLRPASVARAIHNPHLDRLVRRFRESHGGSVIGMSGALREILRILRSGGRAGILPDQSAPPGESHLKFFGESASTYFQYARLLVRSRPDVVFMVCLREGFSFRFRIISRDLTGILSGPGSGEERAEALVKAYLETLEDAIRREPDQYLWMHRRWKNRSPGAPDLYGNLGEPLDLRLLGWDPAV